MKIIHITPSYKPAYIYGGPIISVARLCETLVSNDLDVEVLTTKANGKTELIIPTKTVLDGVKIRFYKRITKDPSHFSPALLWDFYKMLSKQNPQMAVHIHSWWNLTAIASCILAKIKKVPIVLSPRGMLTGYSFEKRRSRSKRLFHYLLGRRLIAYCTIHATSELEKEEILKIAQPKSACIIPNLVYFPSPKQLAKLSPQDTGIPGDTLRLLFFSRIDKKKGIELLFHALVKCHFSWSLTIAGTGEHLYLEKLKRLSLSLGISGKINWIGFVQHEQKYDVLSNHQLLVLCSHNENFANVILESLTVGTAVAISNKIGLAGFVREHRLGWIADLNPNSIAETLRLAHGQQHVRELIRVNAPSTVRTRFNQQKLIEQYKELYQL